MADPSVLVLAAGLSPTETNDADAVPDDVFLQRMYDAGAKACFDVLGVHAPGFKAPPEMSPDQVAADPNYGGHRFFTFRRVEDLRNVMVRSGDAGRQVWLTEFGWTSDTVHPAYAWHAVSEQQKADYLVRAFQYARANWPWIGVMCVWGLPRPDWNPEFEEYWWSVHSRPQRQSTPGLSGPQGGQARRHPAVTRRMEGDPVFRSSSILPRLKAPTTYRSPPPTSRAKSPKSGRPVPASSASQAAGARWRSPTPSARSTAASSRPSAP